MLQRDTRTRAHSLGLQRMSMRVDVQLCCALERHQLRSGDVTRV